MCVLGGGLRGRDCYVHSSSILVCDTTHNTQPTTNPTADARGPDGAERQQRRGEQRTAPPRRAPRASGGLGVDGCVMPVG